MASQESPYHHDVSRPSLTCYLSIDLLCNVMSFLHVRDLFNFAFLCKTNSNAVSVPMVVHAALFAGGNTKRSFNELYKLILSRSIFPPSPLRLLRLACGKRCEICLNQVRRPCNNSVSYVRKGFGVFTCWRCTCHRQFSKGFRKVGEHFTQNRKLYNVILDYPQSNPKLYAWRTIPSVNMEEEQKRARINLIQTRTILFEGRILYQVRDHINYLWKRRMKDRLGESIGPIVTFEILPEMVNTISNWLKSSGQSVTPLIQCYLQDELLAPQRNDNQYIEFIKAYKSTIFSAEAHIKRIKRVRLQGSIDYKIRKVNNCMKMVKSLQGMISNPIVRDCLEFTVNHMYIGVTIGRNFRRGGIRLRIINAPIQFRLVWVHKLLSNYLLSPTTVKKSTLEDLAQNITNEYMKIKKNAGRNIMNKYFNRYIRLGYIGSRN